MRHMIQFIEDAKDNIQGAEIPKIISEDLDPIRILKSAASNWDGATR